MTPSTPPPHGSDDRDARLANRAALLTVACLCSFLLAVLTIPAALQRTDAAAPRILASAPLALSVGAGLMARAARAQLRALRDERESMVEGGAIGRADAGEAGGSPAAELPPRRGSRA